MRPLRTHGVGRAVLSEPWARGTVQTTGNALTLRGNARAYLVTEPNKKVDEPATSRHRSWKIQYEKVKLFSHVLRFSVDVSRVACGCVAAVYLVDMPLRPDASRRSQYCDARPRPRPGGTCIEFDLLEANVHGVHAALHTRPGNEPDGTCNQLGCVVNWGNRTTSAAGVPVSQLYGLAPGAAISTRRRFEVEVRDDGRGAPRVRLSQEGRSTPFWNGSAAGNPTPYGARGLALRDLAIARAALGRGMVLVTSLWTAGRSGAAWLNGDCTHLGARAAGCDLAEAQLVVSNFSLRRASQHRRSVKAAF